MTTPEENPTGYLHEFSQKYKNTSMPKYFEHGVYGPDHLRLFSCKCIFNGYEIIGFGPTKKLAKSDASRRMIILLTKNKFFDRYKSFCAGNTTSIYETVDEQVQQITPSPTALLENSVTPIKEYCQLHHTRKYSENGKLHCFLCHNNSPSVSYHKKYAKFADEKRKTFNIQEVLHPNEISVDRSEEEVNENLPRRLKVLSISNNVGPVKGYVSRLQKYCDSMMYPSLPLYEIEKCYTGGGFAVTCQVGNVRCIGRNLLKKAAKQLAAMAVYKELQERKTKTDESVAQTSTGREEPFFYPSNPINWDEEDDEEVDHKIPLPSVTLKNSVKKIVKNYNIDCSGSKEVNINLKLTL